MPPCADLSKGENGDVGPVPLEHIHHDSNQVVGFRISLAASKFRA